MQVVLIPGFSQPASVWTDVIAALPDASSVTALDVPDDLEFGATAAALGATGGPAVYVGYSMGGRLALRLAVDRPDLVRALVLVSASPGIADDDARAERAGIDAARAAEVQRDGPAVFLRRWLEQPLFATLPPERAALDERVAATTVERLVHQLTVLGTGAMPPLWTRLAELTMPVLLATGALDEKFDAVAREMRARNDRFDHAVLPGGHAVLLESPVALARAIAGFAHRLGAGTE